jgi:hypothetical protein
LDYVLQRLPFRVEVIQTDNGAESTTIALTAPSPAKAGATSSGRPTSPQGYGRRCHASAARQGGFVSARRGR